MENINTLDWLITSKCNDKCGFCYAPSNFNETDESLEYYLEICNYIKKAGFKNVGICGGEPTCFPYLSEIVKYLYSEGLSVSLYTNCYNINEITEILSCLCSISIPLDSISYLNEMRNEDHYKNVVRVLDLLEKSINSPPIVKIGTVVTKVNAHEIPRIFDFITQYKKVGVWKLYQYSPGGKCKSNSEHYEIDETLFNEIVANIPPTNKKIISRNEKQTKGYCVLMSQNGDFYYYDEDYISTNMCIFSNSISEITRLYNSEVNKIQKDWSVV